MCTYGRRTLPIEGHDVAERSTGTLICYYFGHQANTPHGLGRQSRPGEM